MGFIIGLTNLIPGIDGGTVAVILDIYDIFLDVLSMDIKRIKNNLRVVLLMLAGIAIGIIACSHVITFFLENYLMPANFFFIGLILGSLPMIYKRASAERIKPSGVLSFLIGLGLMLMTLLIKTDGYGGEIQRTLTVQLFFFLIGVMILCATAMMIPGFSGTFMLLTFGGYGTVIAALKEWNFIVMIPIAIGAYIGLAGGARLARWLMQKNPQVTYFAILGLVIGSIGGLYPGFSFNLEGAASVLSMLAGAALIYFFSRREDKTEEDKPEDNDTEEKAEQMSENGVE